ncbi:MAG: tetratricopeptide repeat protein [Chloroflexota bacterium]
MANSKQQRQPTAQQAQEAANHNKDGLRHFGQWEMEKAIDAFQVATDNDPDNPEYHLNLARAYVRSGDYQEAMRSLGEYLRTETDENLAARYERLFSSALDDVEEVLIERMRELDMPMQQIGKGIQMWLEYRITLGRRPLDVQEPELWAAALTYAVAKINLVPADRAVIAEAYGVTDRGVKDKYRELITTLDLMPGDYRYFTGDENPLDKLVEAAQLLEEIYERFHEG